MELYVFYLYFYCQHPIITFLLLIYQFYRLKRPCIRVHLEAFRKYNVN